MRILVSVDQVLATLALASLIFAGLSSAQELQQPQPPHAGPAQSEQ